MDKWIGENARPAADVMKELLTYCQGLLKDLGPRTVTLLTDCPDFDLGRLDELGWRTKTWLDPIRYMGGDTRHSQADPGERLDQLGGDHWDKCKLWIQKQAPHAKHSHFPDDDAEYEYYQMLYCDAQRPQ